MGTVHRYVLGDPEAALAALLPAAECAAELRASRRSGPSPYGALSLPPPPDAGGGGGALGGGCLRDARERLLTRRVAVVLEAAPVWPELSEQEAHLADRCAERLQLLGAAAAAAAAAASVGASPQQLQQQQQQPASAEACI